MDIDFCTDTSRTVRLWIVALPVTAWGLKHVFETAAFDITCVGTSPNLAQAVVQIPPDAVDVVVADVDGEDAMHLLPSLTMKGDRPVLVSISSATATLRKELVLTGARGVVEKKEPIEHLIQAVQKIADGGMWLDPDVTSDIFRMLAKGTMKDARPSEQCTLDALSKRERDVVAAVIGKPGAPIKVVAASLNISEYTLRNHLSASYRKLNIKNRAELYALAHSNALPGA